MQIFVRGLSGNTFIVNCDGNGTTVRKLKLMIESSEGIKSDDQHLIYAGQMLIDDDSLLKCYGIEDESTIHLTLGLDGGAKKRKKKNYTTPKKNKHKKKKVKLAVLKFYKVDDNGKITRLRRECENKECGAGVFMANHADRHYCGRCGLTLVYNKPEDK